MNEVLAQNAPLRSEGEVVSYYEQVLSKQLTIKRVLFVGGSVLALVAVGSVAILAIKAGLTLLAAGAILAVGVYSLLRFPLWMLKQENKVRELIMQERNEHLARLKAEARKNPIEQAENDYLRRDKQYDAFKKAMEQIGSQVGSCRSKLEKLKADKPNYDLSEQVRAVEKMELYYNNRLDRLKQAKIKLEAFKEKIAEARTKWDFALAANAAIAVMNATDQDSRMQEILTEVSFEAVQSEFDGIFAKLDVDAAEMSTQGTLEFGSDVKIDIHDLVMDDLVPVKGGINELK